MKKSLFVGVNNCVPVLLMGAYLYSNIGSKYESPINDGDWDILCEFIASKWQEITHPHKVFITDIEYLATTSSTICLNLKEIPDRVKHSAIEFYKEYRQGLALVF